MNTAPREPEPDPDASRVATSKVVTTVFEAVLTAIHEGQYLPGHRISDTTLAAELGVSRTPVREALQRLREIGLVEASASRFTRVAVVSPRQTAQAMIVWLALYDALVEETVPIAPASVAEQMAGDHEAFRMAVAAMDMQQVATTNFSFFSRLTGLSENEFLRKAITSVVHLVRLGSLHLPDYLDFDALTRAQATMLDAVRKNDVPLAHEAMRALAHIRIPLDSPQ